VAPSEPWSAVRRRCVAECLHLRANIQTTAAAKDTAKHSKGAKKTIHPAIVKRT
jgi:hypothetical protein